MPDTLVIGLLMATALRASECYQPPTRQLFNPAFARRFLPPLARLLLVPGIRHLVLGGLGRAEVGGMGMLLCRTRYIDDTLRDALYDGIDQVINMGAGLDTRAFRVPLPEQARIFELDQANVMAWKKGRLEKLLGALPPQLTLVPIDFDRQSLKEVLIGAGYQPERPTFFIWEGVTQYISAEAVDQTLRFVSEMSGPGSRIVFTYIDRAIVDGSRVSDIDAYIMRRAARGGLPWVFGIDPHTLADFLSDRGLDLIEQCDADCYRARYLEPAKRQITIYGGEAMVLAQSSAPGSDG